MVRPEYLSQPLYLTLFEFPAQMRTSMFVLCTKRHGCYSGCSSALVLKGARNLLLALCCLSAATVALAYDEQYSFSTPVGSAYVPATLSGGDGTNNGARFYGPAGLCIDAATNLYVAD